ncbi:hypothetical protein PtA15_17A71 [Puccinia triticina]|uniref:Uncharacterized protein n=1 Tax=Puccinia triticina TaxID=208348 RepID=A0ABY7D5U4_9BASI|nr:uncharacterized protein PtA15_17A71 [Puccinia triticina]WAQ92590.1 hypothetical protein PtA15_17A71 [Puccinia triticina]
MAALGASQNITTPRKQLPGGRVRIRLIILIVVEIGSPFKCNHRLILAAAGFPQNSQLMRFGPTPAKPFQVWVPKPRSAWKPAPGSSRWKLPTKPRSHSGDG